MPSSSLRISLVYRARDCRCTVFVAGTRSLAVVGTRPGARNWLASAFSEEEVCRRGQRGHQRGRSQVSMMKAEETEVPLTHQLLCLQHPLQKIYLARIFIDYLGDRFAGRGEEEKENLPTVPRSGKVLSREGLETRDPVLYSLPQI